MPVVYRCKKPVGQRVGDHREYEPDPFKGLIDFARVVMAAPVVTRETMSYECKFEGDVGRITFYRGVHTNPSFVFEQRLA